MLTQEEQEHKEEIIQLTEDVLQAKGIQCDASISKIPEEQLREIVEKVREPRRSLPIYPFNKSTKVLNWCTKCLSTVEDITTVDPELPQACVSLYHLSRLSDSIWHRSGRVMFFIYFLQYIVDVQRSCL